MEDQMAAILANLESGLAAVEKDESPLGADILNLSSSDPTQQEKAIRAIINATLSDEERQYVLRRDGIAPIVKLLKEGSKPILRTLAAHGLANLALNRDARAAIAREGGIHALGSALLSDNDGLKERGVAALCNLAVAEDDLRMAIVREVSTRNVIQFLTTSRDNSLISASLMLIANIAVNIQIAGLVAADGGVPAVGQYLSTGDASQRRLATFALSALSSSPSAHSQLEKYIREFGNGLQGADAEAEGKLLIALVNLSASSTAAREFVGSGIIPNVVRRIDDPRPQYQAFALQVVQNLGISDAARSSLQSGGAPPKVVQIIKGSNPDLILHALRATTNLCCDGGIRREMNQLGAVPAVERWQNSSDSVVREAAGQALANLRA